MKLSLPRRYQGVMPSPQSLSQKIKDSPRTSLDLTLLLININDIEVVVILLLNLHSIHLHLLLLLQGYLTVLLMLIVEAKLTLQGRLHRSTTSIHYLALLTRGGAALTLREFIGEVARVSLTDVASLASAIRV